MKTKRKMKMYAIKKNLRFKLRWRESCTIIQSTKEISHRFIRVRFGRNSRHTLIKFGKTWTNLSCSLIMAVAMYDVKKCRSICCHKSLSDERLVSQSPFGVLLLQLMLFVVLLLWCFCLLEGLLCHQHNSRLADWSWYSRPVKYRDNDNCYRIRRTDYASHPLSHKEKKI